VQVFGKSFVKIKTKERLKGQQGTEKVNNIALQLFPTETKKSKKYSRKYEGSPSLLMEFTPK